MIKLRLFNFQYIQILAEDKIKKRINRYFEKYAKGYFFSPKYRSGTWNGKVYFYDYSNSTIPYGLFFEYLRFHKENLSDYDLDIDPNIKKKFQIDIDISPKFDLTFHPYEYQMESINTALKYKSGIFRIATGGGKSLIISYINKILFDNNLITKSMIIVPTQLLVEQFYKNMIEYNMPYTYGRFYSKKKEVDNQIVISTWQSLQNRKNMILEYDAIFVDECHGSKAKILSNILKNAYNIKYKYGFTGTLPDDEGETLTIKSFLGPVLKEYNADYLTQKEHLSKCNINVIKLKYNKSNELTHTIQQDGFGYEIEEKIEYPELKEKICTHPFRLDILKNIINRVGNDNILVLVSMIEKEGVVIEKFLQKYLPSKKVFFLSGRDPIKLRNEWVDRCKEEKDIVLIATYQIFQMGIDIPSLKNIVLYTPYRSKIVVLQSIGRGLRKHIDKLDGAMIYDIVDDLNVFRSQYNARKKNYDKECFDITEEIIKEKEFYK